MPDLVRTGGAGRVGSLNWPGLTTIATGDYRFWSDAVIITRGDAEAPRIYCNRRVGNACVVLIQFFSRGGAESAENVFSFSLRAWRLGESQ